MPNEDVTATATFEPIPVSTYAVTVTGGTADGDKFEAGETVTITAIVPQGQQFVSWIIAPAVTFVEGTSATSAVAKFTMPNEDVVIEATFEPETTPDTYTVTFAVTPADATIVFNGQALTGNVAANVENGEYPYSVSKTGYHTATGTLTVNGKDETVTVTLVAEQTSSSEMADVNPLRAWMRNGLLHVTGITGGETLSIYSASGALVYNAIAQSEEMDIDLKVQGVYIISSGGNTVRVVVSQ